MESRDTIEEVSSTEPQEENVQAENRELDQVQEKSRISTEIEEKTNKMRVFDRILPEEG